MRRIPFIIVQIDHILIFICKRQYCLQNFPVRFFDIHRLSLQRLQGYGPFLKETLQVILTRIDCDPDQPRFLMFFIMKYRITKACILKNTV